MGQVTTRLKTVGDARCVTHRAVRPRSEMRHCEVGGQHERIAQGGFWQSLGLGSLELRGYALRKSVATLHRQRGVQRERRVDLYAAGGFPGLRRGDAAYDVPLACPEEG